MAPEFDPRGPQSPAGAGPEVPPGGWDRPGVGTTPRDAPLPGELASWGLRAVAWILDHVIVFGVAGVLALLLVGGSLGIGGDGDATFWKWVGAVILWLILAAAVLFLYAPLLMIRDGHRNGQTLGKQLMRIRAVQDNGQPWTFGPAVLREVVIKHLAVWLASLVVPTVPWLLDNLWPLWDAEDRALHDMAVNSHVVRA